MSMLDNAVFWDQVLYPNQQVTAFAATSQGRLLQACCASHLSNQSSIHNKRSSFSIPTITFVFVVISSQFSSERLVGCRCLQALWSKYFQTSRVVMFLSKWLRQAQRTMTKKIASNITKHISGIFGLLLDCLGSVVQTLMCLNSFSNDHEKFSTIIDNFFLSFLLGMIVNSKHKRKHMYYLCTYNWKLSSCFMLEF